MPHTPDIVDFTTTQVYNPKAGRQRLGIDLEAQNIAIAKATADAAKALAKTPVTGPQGPPGSAGANGSSGANGAQGEQGPQGNQGNQGASGGGGS